MLAQVQVFCPGPGPGPGPDWDLTWTGPGPTLGPGLGPGPELDNVCFKEFWEEVELILQITTMEERDCRNITHYTFKSCLIGVSSFNVSTCICIYNSNHNILVTCRD